MRKNKKLLLASVAAMGALALGVGATSTFAWFSASAAASINTRTADNKSISVTGGSLTIGNFTVKAMPGSGAVSVQLTDTTGKCYVFTGDEAVGTAGTGKVEVPVTAGVGSITCDLLVTYNSAAGEAAKTAGEVKIVWLETIGDKYIDIKATSTDSTVRFLSKSNPSGSEWVGADNTTGTTSIRVSNSALTGISFNAAGCAGNTATCAATGNAAGTGTVYVAVTGDGTNVETTRNININLAPQTESNAV